MRANYTQIKEALAMREAFQGNSMSGEYLTHPFITGQLPRVDAEWFRRECEEANAAGVPFYVVYSYATPIAWAFGNVVRMPDVHYSMTTTKQQTLCRVYLKP